LYRVCTADKGRPIIISSRVIEEYAEPNVMKHFPTFKIKFCPDAVARTMAPESWRILFSQHRQWIYLTVHNLCDLASLLADIASHCRLCQFCQSFWNVFI
jgi:chitin synthase